MNKLVPLNNMLVSGSSKPLKAITEEDKNKLLEYLHTNLPDKLTNLRQYRRERNILLIEFLWETGMRVSDACTVKFSSINTKTENMTFWVEKSDVYHTIPMSKELIFKILRFKDNWIKKPEDKIFPLTRVRAWQILDELCYVVGVDHYSPHSMRHGRAKDDLEKGIPPWAIQQTLAHKDIKTTMEMYVKPGPEDVRKVRGW